MSRLVVLSDQAQADLEEITEYIATDNPLAAIRIASALRAKCAVIGRQAELYPVMDEIAPGFRRALVQPYGIWFEILDDGVVFVRRIVHGARDLALLLPPEG